MIYKVETSLKCAGVCGRETRGEGERREMQTGQDERDSLGPGVPGGAGGLGQWLSVKGDCCRQRSGEERPSPHLLTFDFGPWGTG